ncbi:glycosyltransferase [Ornithinimicrobium flavum]|uniref:glycosyltransferase n=1 Tax=Ornithinimicrobium flavum TaxID=1288636 RepID=UPI0013050F01
MFFYRLSDLLLLYGTTGQRIGVDLGFPRDRTRVVYNSHSSLSDAPSAALVPELLPPPDRPTIGAVLRLTRTKQLEAIIETVAEVNRRSTLGACCLIVGEGPERERLETQAAAAGVDLYLPGAIYSVDALEEVYRRIDVTLVPVAAGLTVLQSLNAGTPVVTVADAYRQMPEFEAIIDGRTGTLTSDLDPREFAIASLFWLRQIGQYGESIANEIRALTNSRWSPTAQADAIVKAVNFAVITPGFGQVVRRHVARRR